jgi:hypothetical protein
VFIFVVPQDSVLVLLMGIGTNPTDMLRSLERGIMSSKWNVSGLKIPDNGHSTKSNGHKCP